MKDGKIRIGIHRTMIPAGIRAGMNNGQMLNGEMACGMKILQTGGRQI